MNKSEIVLLQKELEDSLNEISSLNSKCRMLSELVASKDKEYKHLIQCYDDNRELVSKYINESIDSERILYRERKVYEIIIFSLVSVIIYLLV